MSIWKKIGGFAKKALPFAAMALPFIPGVGNALSGVAGAVGRAFGGGSAPSSAQSASIPWSGPVSHEDASDSSSGAWFDLGGGMRPPTASLPRWEVTAPRLPEAQGSSFDWSGLLKSAAPALGAAASGAASVAGQREANVANAEMAQKQMDFQERLSNTQWQRGTKDMQAAGLNPMLAYSQGGASSPSGATATMSNELGAGVSSALQGMSALQQLEATQASIGQTEAATRHIGAQIANTQAQTGYTTAQELKTLAEVREQMPKQRDWLDAQIGKARADTTGSHLSNEYAAKTMKPRVSQAHSTSEIVGYAREGAYNQAEHQKKYEWWNQNAAPFFSNALDTFKALAPFIPK